jgi:TolB protein
MRSRKNIGQCCVGLQAVICLCFICALMAVYPSPAYSLNGMLKQITTNSANQTDPAISGDYIVYTDDRNGNKDIYLYDLGTSVETNLTPGTTNDQYLADIDGVRVVFTDVNAGGSDIYMIDLSTSLVTPLTAGGINYSPAINGNHVTWVTQAGSAQNVVLADLTTWTTATLTASPVAVEGPRVDGNWVVWAEYISGSYQIRAYNIATSEYRIVTTDTGDHRNPDVSGDIAVWADHRGSSWDIYRYQFSSGTTTQVTASVADEQYPRISGSRLVWQDTRSGVSQLWTQDLAGGSAEPVYPTSTRQFLNAIDGNNIVWTEARTSNYDIFMFTIGAVPQPVCGDGTCNGTETCSSCPADCGVCPPPTPVCGDGICNGQETCSTCSDDCGTCPSIFVSPLDYNFGTVTLGTSSKTLITLTNLGTNNLTVNSIDPSSGSSTYFSLSPAPVCPFTISPGQNVDIGVAFAPTSLGDFNAIFRISSTDPINPLVDVSFSGIGVKAPVPPSQQIGDILAFFDASVANGTLLGDGSGSSANGRRDSLRNMLKATGDMITIGDIYGACGQLKDSYLRTDGLTPPPDFVKGPASPTLAGMIQDLMADLGCN